MRVRAYKSLSEPMANKSLTRPGCAHGAHSTTYVGDDFPRYLPTNTSGNDLRVVMFLAESSDFLTTHKTLTNWEASLPPEVRYVRLGPTHRVFAISMFHQLHCLHQIAIRLADMDPSDKPWSPLPDWQVHGHLGHTQHCLNNIRQNILCAADETVEDGSWKCRNREVVRTRGGRECRDWASVYEFVQDNYDAWKKIRS